MLTHQLYQRILSTPIQVYSADHTKYYEYQGRHYVCQLFPLAPPLTHELFAEL